MVAIIIGSAGTAYGNYLLTPMANALKANNNSQFIMWIVATILFNIVGRFLQFIASYAFTIQQEHYTHDLRKRIVQNYYTDKNAGQLKVSSMQNRLTNDLKLLNQQYLNPVYNITLSTADLIFSIYFVLTFNYILLILILVLAFIMMILPGLVQGKLQQAIDRVSSSNNQYLDTIEKWLNGLAVLKRYRKENKLLNVLTGSSKVLEDAEINHSKRDNQMQALNYAADIISQTVILLVTGLLIMNNNLSFGAFFSIGNFASLIFGQLATVTSQIGEVKSTKNLNLDVEKNLTITPEQKLESLDDLNTISTHNLALQFENGESIKYPDLKINAGEKILLTGDSGAGKSTLFKLILGEFKPSQGSVVFKNKAGEDINPDRSQMGYIPQDPVLFPGTIQDNITMFDDSLNKSAETWAKKVELVTDLKKFPDGIKTKVDLDKNNLSGGQRQKVILARTEVYNSRVILIDEGTSAIDSIATEKILQNLLAGPETIIFIAHNLTPKMHQMFDREIHLSK